MFVPQQKWPQQAQHQMQGSIPMPAAYPPTIPYQYHQASHMGMGRIPNGGGGMYTGGPYMQSQAPDPMFSGDLGMYGMQSGAAPYPTPSPIGQLTPVLSHQQYHQQQQQQHPGSGRRSGAPPQGISPPMSPQQQPQDQMQSAEKFKTELCRKFALTGFCRYGDMCQFAHGMNELRALVRHPLYKTSACKSFESTGQCRYGARCRFIHDEDMQELSTLARGVPAINLQITEPSWEEAQAAALDAVQHLVVSSGMTPELMPSTLVPGQSPSSQGQGGRIPIPDPVSLDGSRPRTNLMPSPVEANVGKERTVGMGSRNKSMEMLGSPTNHDGSRTLSAQRDSSGVKSGEVRSISSLIMMNNGTNHSPTHSQQQPRVVGSNGSGGIAQAQRVASSVKLVIGDDEALPPAPLDARRLPVANSGSWVNLSEMASSTTPKAKTSTNGSGFKHSYSQPVLGGDTTWSSFPSDSHLSSVSATMRRPTGSISSFPVLPPTSPMNQTVASTSSNANGRMGGSSTNLNGFASSTSSPNLVKAFSSTAVGGEAFQPRTGQNSSFKKAASYANHIWFESNADVDEQNDGVMSGGGGGGGGWGSMARARSVEGRLDIFRNLSDQDLAKTAQAALKASHEEKLGELGLTLSDDEDRATEDGDKGNDTEEDEGFMVGKF